jgi:uncharacterized protein YdcH (DUF465 family)
MEKAHFSALITKHAGLDARIAAEQGRPAPNMALVAELKKKKLKIKEEMLLPHAT